MSDSTAATQRILNGAGVQRVTGALSEAGIDADVRVLPDSTRTAGEAAAALGCAVEQIAKTLVFRGRESGRPVVVVAGGAHRVDEGKLAALAGEPVDKPDAAYVRERTGFPIGGVPPAPHDPATAVFVDEALLAQESVWAAAGHPHAVVRLTADELLRGSGGRRADVKA